MAQIGLEFEQLSVSIDESPKPREPAAQYVKRIALEKAKAILSQPLISPAWVVGGDTAIVIDGEVLGKPKSKEEAIQYLSRLSGKTHQVLSAVSVVQEAEEQVMLNTTLVTFTELSDEMIQGYIELDEYRGKAGAYAIQGAAAKFIKNIEGSYSGVMGLPLHELNQLLEKSGYRF